MAASIAWLRGSPGGACGGAPQGWRAPESRWSLQTSSAPSSECGRGSCLSTRAPPTSLSVAAEPRLRLEELPDDVGRLLADAGLGIIAHALREDGVQLDPLGAAERHRIIV